jgi:hypothetical protein
MTGPMPITLRPTEETYLERLRGLPREQQQREIERHIAEREREFAARDKVVDAPQAETPRTPPAVAPQPIVAALREARMRAQAEGLPEPTQEQMEAYIRRESGGRYSYADLERGITARRDPTIGDLGRGLLQGLTAEWGDELVGLADSATGANFRARDREFSEDFPGLSLGTRVAGSMPWMLAPGVGPATNASIKANAARGALAGAAAGGLAGAGAADEGDRLAGATRGAVVGGVTGGALTTAAGAASRLLPAERARVRLEQAMQRGGGADATRRSMARFAAAGKGDEAMLADLLPGFRSEADVAANNADEVFERFTDIISARQEGQAGRLLKDVRYAAGNPIADQRLEHMIGQRRAWAASEAGFEGLRTENPIVAIPPDVQKARLANPTLRRAWDLARRGGDMTPENQMAGYAFAEAVAEGRLPRPISFDDIHTFKQELDDRAGAAFASGKGNLGRAYATVRKEIDDVLGESVPGYREVSDRYRSMIQKEQALQEGVAAWKVEDTRGLADRLQGMTVPERVEFRMGMASELLASLRGTASNRDAAARLMNRSEALDGKLRIVFGDRRTYDEFVQKAAVEADMARLRGVVGGSATHRRGAAAEFDPLESAASVVSGSPAVAAMRQAGGSAIMRGTKRRTAQAAAPLLMARGPKAIADAIRRIEKRHPLTGRAPVDLSMLLGFREGGLMSTPDEP